MAFIVINTNRTVVDAPVSTDLLTDMALDLNYLNTTQGSQADASGVPTIQNGSFEADPSGTINSPQGWTFQSGTGGSGQVTNAAQAHGGQSYAITRSAGSGNSGGALLSPFNNCSPLNAFEFLFMMMNNTAGVQNVIYLVWYYANQTPTGLVTEVYNNNNQPPNTWQAFSQTVTPPNGSYYFVAILALAQVGASACTVYVDGISTRPYIPFQNSTKYQGLGSFTFTCPPGCFKVRVRLFGQGNGGSQRGGYSEGVMTLGIFPNAQIAIGLGEPSSVSNAYYNFGAHNNPAIPSSSDGATFGNAPIQLNSFSTVLSDGNINNQTTPVAILEW